jgi:hypothetical protein
VAEFDDGRKHIEEGNEVEDDGSVDEELIGAAGGVVELADEEDGSGDGTLDEDGDPRGFPAWMNFSEGRGKIAVDADDEGDAGDACDGRANSAGVADGDEEGGKDAEESDFEGDGADGDGVEDSALGIEVGGGNEGEDGEGSGDVDEGGEGSRRRRPLEVKCGEGRGLPRSWRRRARGR